MSHITNAFRHASVLVLSLLVVLVSCGVEDPYTRQEEIALEQPPSFDSAAWQDAIRIDIGADGSVSLNGETTPLTDLVGTLESALGSSKQPYVVISANPKARIGMIIAVRDAVRDSSAERFSLILDVPSD